MNETLYYLVNMPEPLTKQTLCVILDIEEKPKHWEDITKGKFFIINGRYSVGTSIRMQISVLPDEKCRNSCNKIVSLCGLRQKSTLGNIGIFQSMQSLQHVQANMGDQCTRGKIHQEQAR
jgi:hypothetical protein